LKKVAIVGGGLAGLISGIELSKKGVPCVLFEKKKFPFHRVCGEYVSNEALPFLKSAGLYPGQLNPSLISSFLLTSVRGQTATMPLDIGGFGISRFAFDHFLLQVAAAQGVEIHENTEIMNIDFRDDIFQLKTSVRSYDADVVIGAFGKRSRLDVQLNRAFIRKRSPYIGVKYHVKTDHPENLIALHNFPGGYCGVVNVENGLTNLCYLAERKVLLNDKNIPAMEKNSLGQNPHLRALWKNAEFMSAAPLVINEVSFSTKNPVTDHILMAGDAAGMITPLCGNGMAMAIHSAKLVSRLVMEFCTSEISRSALERAYSGQWRKTFARRLMVGRAVQKLFGNSTMSSMAVAMMSHVKPVAGVIMRNTHGQVF
jgi:menaquinone-9 beta-reductase